MDDACILGKFDNVISYSCTHAQSNLHVHVSWSWWWCKYYRTEKWVYQSGANYTSLGCPSLQCCHVFQYCAQSHAKAFPWCQSQLYRQIWRDRSSNLGIFWGTWEERLWKRYIEYDLSKLSLYTDEMCQQDEWDRALVWSFHVGSMWKVSRTLEILVDGQWAMAKDI